MLVGHRSTHLLLAFLLALLGCRGSDTRIPTRPAVVLDTVLGRFVSGTIDAYCDAVDAGFLEAGAMFTRNAVVLYARHGLTCREAVLQDYAKHSVRIASDPMILQDIGVNLLSRLGYWDYDVVRIENELVYDATAADECFAELRARGLYPTSLESVPACRNVFDGTTPIGATCSDDGECAGDAYCGAAVEADGTCTHSVCTARGAAGTACSGAFEDGCTAGTELGIGRCGGGATSRVCEVGQRLITNLVLGEPCRADDAYQLCDAGLRCFQRLGAPEPVCIAPIARGGDCTRDPDSETYFAPCESGSVCVSSGATATCVAQRLATRVGDACGHSLAPEVACDTLARLHCASDGRCASIGDGTIGAACRKELSEFDCNPGLRCHVVDDLGTCQIEDQPIGALNDPCVFGVDWTETCASGLECASRPDSNVSRCEPYPFAAGSRCSRDADCASGLSCRPTENLPPWDSSPRTYVCMAPSADGSDCQSDSHCVSGVCRTSDKICGASKVPSLCARDAECGSGLCVNNFCSVHVSIAEPCDLTRLCPAGSYCPSPGATTRVCTVEAADGATCTESRECTSRFCDATTNTCQPPRAIGNTCTEGSDECGTHACTDTVTSGGVFVCATRPLPNGTRCEFSSDCASGICGWNSTLMASYCRDAGATGSECDVSAECISDRCVHDFTTQTASCGELLASGEGCSSDAQCAAGVCRAPPNATASVYPPGRCGDWADICFDGAFTHGW